MTSLHSKLVFEVQNLQNLRRILCKDVPLTACGNAAKRHNWRIPQNTRPNLHVAMKNMHNAAVSRVVLPSILAALLPQPSPGQSVQAGAAILPLNLASEDINYRCLLNTP